MKISKAKLSKIFQVLILSWILIVDYLINKILEIKESTFESSEAFSQ
jgi:hypothetical protein